jgi:hypothetical protein
MIFLDTDVVIDIFRQYPPAMAWLDPIVTEKIILSGFVVMELIQGCKNKTDQEKIERKLINYDVAWASAETGKEALSVFSRYHLSHKLGIFDALIGQTAVALNLPLYTFNQKHYSVIPNLRTVRPYEK